MGIAFLMGFLFFAVTVFVVYISYEKRNKTPKKKLKWVIGLALAIVGMLLGIAISIDVGEKIAKKYLASQTPVTVLENIDLLPFSGSFGVYIVTGENHGEKVVWYLQEEGVFEELHNDIIDRNIIVFSNALAPVKQLVKVNVGSFWKWFAIIPSEYRFVIPAGGLQEGMVVKTYKYISAP